MARVMSLGKMNTAGLQDQRYANLAKFMTKLLPVEIRRNYSEARNYTQVLNQAKASHLLSKDGKISEDRLRKHMRRYYHQELPPLSDEKLQRFVEGES